MISPYIGIKPSRLPRVPLAHTRIEDMASFYIEEIRKKQPHGPYLLAGMCAGGLIAYEMASQLVQAGETVDLVALLDAVTPQAPKNGTRAENRAGGMKQSLMAFEQGDLTPAERARAVVQTISQKLVYAFTWRYWHYRNFGIGLRAPDLLFCAFCFRMTLPWPGFVPELKVKEILYFALGTLQPPKALPVSPTRAGARHIG